MPTRKAYSPDKKEGETMNFKQYYERESQKTYWQRERDHSKRLFPKREKVKTLAIRANYEIELTQKANPRGWMFITGVMGFSFMLMIAGLVIVLLVEFDIISASSNCSFTIEALLWLPLIAFMLCCALFGVVTRRLRK